MGKSRDERPAAPGVAPANPFAALAGLRGTLPAGTAEPEPSAPAAVPVLDGKLVLQRERKGRGGKTVTLLRGVALEGDALAEFARELRQALGTGGGVEHDAILLAGDQMERAAAWLRQRGAKRIVIGN